MVSIKKVFLSKQNLLFVYENLQYEIKHRFDLKIEMIYLDYTKSVMNHVYSGYSGKLTKRFQDQPKNTIIILNSIVIKRLVNDLVKKKEKIEKVSPQDFFASYRSRGGVPISSLGKVKYAVPISEILDDVSEGTNSFWVRDTFEKASPKLTTDSVPESYIEDKAESPSRQLEQEAHDDENDEENVVTYETESVVHDLEKELELIESHIPVVESLQKQSDFPILIKECKESESPVHPIRRLQRRPKFKPLQL